MDALGFDEINGVEKCLCLSRNIFQDLVYLFGNQEDGTRGFLTLLWRRQRGKGTRNEGRFPALCARLARNRSMGSPWRQTSPYLYSPRCFPMKLRPATLIPNFSYTAIHSFHPGPKVVGLSQVAFTPPKILEGVGEDFWGDKARESDVERPTVAPSPEKLAKICKFRAFFVRMKIIFVFSSLSGLNVSLFKC